MLFVSCEKLFSFLRDLNIFFGYVEQRLGKKAKVN